MSVSRTLRREIEADIRDSNLSYDAATIADRLESVDENLSLLTTDDARAQMLQALVDLWTPSPATAQLAGYPEYGTPQYNAIEIVVIAISDLLSEW